MPRSAIVVATDLAGSASNRPSVHTQADRELT